MAAIMVLVVWWDAQAYYLSPGESIVHPVATYILPRNVVLVS